VSDRLTWPVPVTGSGAGYLDTPSMGLPTQTTVAAMKSALLEWATGVAEYQQWEATMERCRALFAQLVAVSETDIGLIPSVVPAVAAVSETVAERPGTVVAHRSEFRSLLLPALSCFGEDRFRWAGGPYLAESFIEMIDESTTAVVISSVASHNGARPALAAVREACTSVGATLMVDGTQSAGIIPLDVPVADLDLFSCAGYKGLRGPRGTAYAFARNGVVGRVRAASPYGVRDVASRGTYGPPYAPRPGAQSLDQSPAWLSWVGAEGGLRSILDFRHTDEAARILSYTERLRAGLVELGYTAQETDLPSPIVSVAADDPGELVKNLAAAGVRAAHRNGRVRLGFHTYNTSTDVDTVLAVLARQDPGSPCVGEL
jgi:selenocysteine lyase/cysteine desulfurase